MNIVCWLSISVMVSEKFPGLLVSWFQSFTACFPIAVGPGWARKYGRWVCARAKGLTSWQPEKRTREGPGIRHSPTSCPSDLLPPTKLHSYYLQTLKKYNSTSPSCPMTQWLIHNVEIKPSTWGRRWDDDTHHTHTLTPSHYKFSSSSGYRVIPLSILCCDR